MRSQAQYTIYSLNDVYTGTSAPQNPYKGQLWVDTSQSPPLTKVYNGSAWKEQNGTDTIKSNVQTLTTKQATLETNLNGLTSTVEEQTQVITGIGEDLDTAKEDINVLESDVSALEQTASSISAEVANKANSSYGNSSSSFGWKLTSSGFELYSNGKTVMKVNNAKLEVNGKIVSTDGSIAGFTLSNNSIFNGVTSFDDTSHNGVYIGTDGIRLGPNFTVDPSGVVTAVGLTINLTDSQKAELKGAKGDKGDKGDTGATGATGATGPTGPAGSDATVNWTNICNALAGSKESQGTARGIYTKNGYTYIMADAIDASWISAGILSALQGKIGGFNITSNSLYAGTPGSNSGIELTSVALNGYKSNNQGVQSSQSISKITINNATNLTIYIRSYAESNYDYTIASTVNASSVPTAYNTSNVKAHTRGNQKSGKTLSSYTKVEYTGLKSGDFIYIVFRKDGSADTNDDTGYILIPDTSDISLASNGDTYYFVRDTSLDIKGASIKVGSNFSVDNTGAITAKSGRIGNLEVSGSGLKYTNSSYGTFSIGEESTDDRLPKYAISASNMRINNAFFGFKSDSYYGVYWTQLDSKGLSVYYTDGEQAAECKTNISINEMMRIPAFENIYPTSGRHIRIWCGRMSLAQDAWGSIYLGGYFSTISYVYATCQATASNESLSGTKGICMTYISGTTVYIANDGAGTRYVTYLVIGY